MKYKVAIISLGCSKNLIDSEMMMGILKNEGYEFTDEIEEAEIVIVNTCTFINDAKEESIDTIIQVGYYKKNSKCKYLIVAGCLSERYKDELMKEIPEIDGLIGTGNVAEIMQMINELVKGKKSVRVGNVDKKFEEDLPRLVTTPSYTAYVKIAEGCNNYCTYCVIPKIRGKYRSRKFEDIVKEVENLVNSGVKEIILIAQDTTKYGIDIYGEYKLPQLLDQLNKIEGLKWIRLLYLYPDQFSDQLIQSIKRNNKVVSYVDMPIQHINNNILKRMNRKTSKQQITSIVKKLRNEIPDIVIRTTLIVGFPGETEEDFNELYNYVKETKFDRLGVFTYSKEEGTPAAKFEQQIDEDIKHLRQEKIMKLQMDISYEKNKNRIGKTYDVLIEEKIEENVYLGRTYMDAPEIDGIVYVHSTKKLEIGAFVNTKITDTLEYDLIGGVSDELSK